LINKEITILFSQETFYDSEVIPCSFLFDSSTISKFGGGRAGIEESCKWETNKKLIISLGDEPSLVDGEIIAFLDDVIYDSEQISSYSDLQFEVSSQR
jgi:hypothetical protein